MARFSQPAEWSPHEAVWVAWPSAPDLWNPHLAAAQQAFAAMCAAIADPDPSTGKPRGERIELLVPNEARRREAVAQLKGLSPRAHAIPFGDIWLRDTAPIFVRSTEGALRAACFRFNGWGEKYVLPGDDRVAERVASAAEVPSAPYDWVLEGGSVEVDGEGTVLTTRQCLLHPTRNPNLDSTGIEARLREALGVDTVLWLHEGLLNDHTDGHVDNLARFVAPGVVVCMEPASGDDPNNHVLRSIASELGRMTDAAGRRLEVVRIPSPGRVEAPDGHVLPASYVNFYIGNRAVVVPTYGSPSDDAAVRAIGDLFSGRRTLGIDARAILSGGGAFHCITQQEPIASGTDT